MKVHADAALGPAGRLALVEAIESGMTLEGASVKFSVKGKSAYVNNAKVITANILCSNGIVHAINQVLIPPNL